jgi:hypothetical protein
MVTVSRFYPFKLFGGNIYQHFNQVDRLVIRYYKFDRVGVAVSRSHLCRVLAVQNVVVCDQMPVFINKKAAADIGNLLIDIINNDSHNGRADFIHQFS